MTLICTELSNGFLADSEGESSPCCQLHWGPCDPAVPPTEPPLSLSTLAELVFMLLFPLEAPPSPDSPLTCPFYSSSSLLTCHLLSGAFPGQPLHIVPQPPTTFHTLLTFSLPTPTPSQLHICLLFHQLEGSCRGRTAGIQKQTKHNLEECSQLNNLK